MSERTDASRPYVPAGVVEVETATVAPLGSADGEEPEDTAQMREEIEQTRVELSSTINAIQDRLNPQTLVEQAKETARDAATDMVTQAKETVREATIGKAEQMVSSASDTARGTGSSVMETIKQNPVPAALVALGVGWLWMNRAPGTADGTSVSSYGDSYGSYGVPATTAASYGRSVPPLSGAGSVYGVDGPSSATDGRGDAQGMVGKTLDQVQNTAGQVVAQAQSGAGYLADQAQSGAGYLADQAQSGAGAVVEGTQQRARQAQGQARQMLQDTPLAVGGIALALGAAVGLALPETPPEHSLMGEARDTLVQRAQEAAQETMHKVGDVAQAATSSAVGAAKTAARE